MKKTKIQSILESFLIILIAGFLRTGNSNKLGIKCQDVIDRISGYSCDGDKEIWEGSFGVAFKIKNEVGESFAFKVEKKHNKNSGPTEYDNILLLDHPNIIKVYTQFSDDYFKGFVMEYAKHGDFKNFLELFPEYTSDYKKTLEIFYQIITGIVYLAGNDYVHTDLKPGNIIVDANQTPKIIIIDLLTKSGTKSGLKGTISYIDPEIVINYAPKSMYIYDKSNNVYALGVILYKMTQGNRSPFPDLTKEVLKTQLIKGNYKIAKGTPLKIANLIHACLQKNKTNRITAQELQKKVSEILAEPMTETILDTLELNNNRPFEESKAKISTQHHKERPFSLLEEFSEMIFVFLLAFGLIPVTIFCIKKKVTQSSGRQNQTTPLASTDQNEVPNHDVVVQVQ